MGFQPQFSNRCDWTKLSGGNWSDLLRSQPQFAGMCIWNKLVPCDWGLLLEKQPQFVEECPYYVDNMIGFSIGKSECDERDFDYDFCDVLSVQPQLFDKVICSYDEFDGWSWSELLRSQPQFSDRCDWAKLSGRDWSKLLGSQPQFSDRCDWAKLNGDDWSNLLRSQPQFAEYRK